MFAEHVQREELRILRNLLLLGTEGGQRIHISEPLRLRLLAQVHAGSGQIAQVLRLLGGHVARYLPGLYLVGVVGVLCGGCGLTSSELVRTLLQRGLQRVRVPRLQGRGLLAQGTNVGVGYAQRQRVSAAL